MNNNNHICIDFGTCNTVITYINNKSEEENVQQQIYDEYTGDVLIPSTIYINNLRKNINDYEYEIDYVIGNNANININNSDGYYFHQFKRFMGICKTNVESCKDFLKTYNYDYETDEDTLFFKFIDNDNNTVKLSNSDLLILYFKALYKIISNTINCEGIIPAVFTCPAYFYDSQRHMLKYAAEKSSFSIFKIYNEPTSAAVYYIDKYFKKGECKNEYKNVIIYDLGGGTLDATLVQYHYNDNICEIIDICGDNNLGGIDIDNILVNYIINKYNIDKTNKKWYSRIKKIAEQIKISLTYSESHTEYLECVPILNKQTNIISYQDNLQIIITKHIFNTIINDIIDKMVEPIKKMVNEYIVDDIIYIGGPTQIPLLKSKVNCFFNSETVLNTSSSFLYKTIVSLGGSLMYKKITSTNDFNLLDIIPMNIGISDNNNNMQIMIEKNSKIPITVKKTFMTSYDCQRSIDIDVYEGIDTNNDLNTIIGSYKIVGIPPLPKGMIIIDLIFTINNNGILNISIDGYRNSSDNNVGNADFKLNNTIRLLSTKSVKEIMRKILLDKKN